MNICRLLFLAFISICLSQVIADDGESTELEHQFDFNSPDSSQSIEGGLVMRKKRQLDEDEEEEDEDLEKRNPAFLSRVGLKRDRHLMLSRIGRISPAVLMNGKRNPALLNRMRLAGKRNPAFRAKAGKRALFIPTLRGSTALMSSLRPARSESLRMQMFKGNSNRLLGNKYGPAYGPSYLRSLSQR